MHTVQQSSAGTALTTAGLYTNLIAAIALFTNFWQVLARSYTGYELACTVLFHACVLLLLLGNFNYLLARFGYYRRLATFAEPSRDSIEAIYDLPSEDLVILVPSFKEEIATLRMTLLSAALMEHPKRQVTLLIDDPHQPSGPADSANLAMARQLPDKLRAELEAIDAPLRMAFAGFNERLDAGLFDACAESKTVAALYERAAEWLEAAANQEMARHRQGQSETPIHFFCRLTLLEPAAEHRRRAAQILAEPHGLERIVREYRRLASLFSARFTSFERKAYANFPHGNNKAMNLNAYLGLLGRDCREVCRGEDRVLEDCDREVADISVPDAAYIAVLDADSLLSPDYALKLFHVMSLPGHERLGLAQTPYSAFPGATDFLADIAGATTDIYYPIHQGLCAGGAAFWVGPNSIIRRQVLRDIQTVESERGYKFPVFIRDRTAIEDADTTIDVIGHGWVIYSYMQRLAFSATPPDFVALLTQRERWANGGLLLVPKLVRQILLCRKPFHWALLEAFLRFTSLGAAGVTGICMAILILFSFDDSQFPNWLPLMTAPFYILVAKDLQEAGRKPSDVFRLFSLNLILLPVMLGGTALSLKQAFTGRKAKFNRTPRSGEKTKALPTGYSVAVWSVFLYAAFWAVRNTVIGSHASAVLPTIVAFAYWYGITYYMRQLPTVMGIASRMTTFPVALAKSTRLFLLPLVGTQRSRSKASFTRKPND